MGCSFGGHCVWSRRSGLGVGAGFGVVFRDDSLMMLVRCGFVWLLVCVGWGVVLV